MNAVESRFINDPLFHAVVCSMQQIIEQYQLTPSEMRDAVMLACVNFEQRRSRTAVLFGACYNYRLTHAAENGEAPRSQKLPEGLLKWFERHCCNPILSITTQRNLNEIREFVVRQLRADA